MQERNSIRRGIFLKLRDEIRMGRFSHGSYLPGEFSLAEKLGVSRVSVRAALQDLEKEKYICSIPRKGWEIRYKNVNQGKDLRPVAVVFSSGIFQSEHEEVVRELDNHFNPAGIPFSVNFFPGKDIFEYLLRLLDKNLFRGIIFVSGLSLENHIPHEKLNGLPVIGIMCEKHLFYDTISADNALATEMICGHLLSRGIDNLLMLGCSIDDASFGIRRDCFKRLAGTGHFKSHYYELSENIIFPDEWTKILDFVVKNKIKGIIGVTDVIASDAIHHLSANGFSIPADISVAGFGAHADIERLSFYGLTGLASIRYPWKEMGMIAAELMISKLDGKNSSPKKILVPPTLAEGDSVRDMKYMRQSGSRKHEAGEGENKEREKFEEIRGKFDGVHSFGVCL